MSFNGSGTFVINTAGQPVVSGTVISSTAFNALTADLATGLSTCITKDGQTTPTANIPMGNNKITGLAVGTAATDAANLSQVQSTTAKLITASGTDTVTGTLSPTLTAYAAGQMFYWVAAGTNTGAVTLNIDSLGAKAVTRDGSTALTAGDLRSGEVIVVVYDGTRFQVVSQVNSGGDATFANVSITSALNVGGVATFTGNPVLSGGTANGVLYLNGSKVATSGSALVFDGTNLGIGTSSPATKLDVAGDISLSNEVYLDNGKYIRFKRSSGGLSIQTLGIESGTDNVRLLTTGSLKFVDGSLSTLMLLNSSGNLGIGTSSPGAKLHVLGSNLVGIFAGTNANTAYTEYRYNSTTVAGYIGNGSSILSAAADSDFIIRSEGALKFLTNGNNLRATIDSSGNLGLGVTPSAWSTAGKNMQFGNGPASIGTQNSGDANFMHNAYESPAGTFKYVSSGIGSLRYQLDINNNAHKWYYAASGTAGNTISFTQAMTLDASGRLGIGTTSPAQPLHVDASGGGVVRVTRLGTSATAYGQLENDGTNSSVTTTGALIFNTGSSPAERARITSGGYFKASNNGSYYGSTSTWHEINQSAGDTTAYFVSYAASGAEGIVIRYNNQSPNGTGNIFLNCVDSASGGTQRAAIRSNGGFANYQANDVNLSDQRVKKDVKPLGSMWDKFKAIEIVTFKYNDQTHDDDNIGVIAQQVEAVAPEFIDVDGFGETPEDGVPLKTVYTTDMYHAAIKALQEAMARIEQLEAKVAALEAK